MKYFYSLKSKGFYVDGVNKKMPDDIVEITKNKHTALTNPPDGKVLSWASGSPALVNVVENHNDSINGQINELKSKITIMEVCDALISGDVDFIKDIKTQIDELRGQL